MSSSHVEALEALLRTSTPHAAELKTALSRLSAEIRSRLDRGSDAVDFVEASVKAVARLKGANNAELRMTVLCDSGQYLFSNGRSAEALVAAGKCESLAKRTANDDWLSKSQCLQTIVHAELGNIGQALIQGSNALTIARRTQNTIREISVLINLGIALNYGGLSREAIQCFDRVLWLVETPEGIRETRRLGQFGGEFALSALSNKSQSHYDLDQLEESFAAIDECLRRCREPWDALSSERRAVREFAFVQVALEVGKLANARDHTRLCHQYGRVSERGRFHARVALALCEVHGGDSDSGIRKLEVALGECRTTNERVTILSPLIRAYEQMGRPEQALENVQTLLSLVRAQREEGISALLSISAPDRAARLVRNHDLDALAVREAVLRARVAERRLVTERLELFERFAVAADLREEPSGRHGYRVGRLSALLGERIGCSRDAIAALEMAARLHDIGKIAMPDRLLFSPLGLSDGQRRFMTTHTVIGSELLAKSNLPELRLAEEIARHHHECWDGTGYPSKLSGKRIPIHARIVALADVFDALTHGRPYAPAWPIDRAIEEIRNRRGTQFDPELSDTFLELIDELRRKHSDLDAFLGEAGRNSPFLQARDKIRLMLDGERRAENIAAAAAETVH